METDRDAIHRRRKSCLAAMNRGDIDAVMEHYVEDAVLLFSGFPVLRGPEEISAHWEQVDRPDRDARLDTLDIRVVGDLAYEVALYEVKAVGDDGEPQVSAGKNVVVWRREDDGEWRLAVDICAADV